MIWKECAARLRSADAAEDSEGAGGGDVDESAAVDGGAIDLLVGRAAPVGGVGEHIVDRERAPDGHVRGPAFVVCAGRFDAVAAVDEDERQRAAPRRGD